MYAHMHRVRESNCLTWRNKRVREACKVLDGAIEQLLGHKRLLANRRLGSVTGHSYVHCARVTHESSCIPCTACDTYPWLRTVMWA